ncbi:MAG: tetratricopeptide repeat protein [Planctomycetia bacterium]|nr:tetratricopeptide repeat protein [Planctomycetia bacterium]
MPAPATERRVLTVLFSDLSGFTSLSEHMDPEDVTDIIDSLFRRLRAAIEKEGGTVDKFIGDAVMAVFGAPVTHADDPLRAVRAGLAMQREMSAFNAERKLELALRIGINTGEALWGSVAGDRPTAMGDAVNVAQRLEGLARPGTVLVTRGVERATFRRIEYRAQESKTLKGRTEAVAAFEAVGEKAGVTDAAGAGFFGREEELGQLLEWHRKGGALVAIEGDAGIGKSRLAAEFLSKLKSESPQAWTATGRAPEGGKVALGALVDVVRTAAGGAKPVEWLAAGYPAGTGDAARATGARLIARSLGLDSSPLENIDPANVADLTRAAWAGWLRGRAPLALVLDDMEHADSALVALLSALAPLLRGSRASILVTARHGFSAPAGFRRLALGPLKPEAVAALAADALGRPVQPGLVQFLLERTGGSPFYSAQLARWLDDEGLLEGAPATLARRPERLPDGLQTLLVARLDALDAEARDAMKTASVFGRSFWRGVLTDVAGRDTAREIASATREEVVEERPASALPGDAEFAFRQSLIQEAAYSLLTKRDRARLHAAAATALEARAPVAGRAAMVLAAQQRELEGKGDEAARLWLGAAKEAAAVQAWDEAAAHAREARRLGAAWEAACIELRAAATAGIAADAGGLLAIVEAAPGIPPGALSRALIDHSSILQHTQGPEKYLAATEAAVARADDAHRTEARYFRLSALALSSRLEEGLAAADEMLRDVAAVPPGSTWQARVLVQRGLMLQRRGEYDAAERDYNSAVETFRARGETRSLAGALRGRGLLLRNRGRHPDAIRDLDEAESLVRNSGDHVALASILMQRCPVLRQLGRREEALASVREAAALAREFNLITTLVNSLTAEGNVHSDSGDAEAAKRCWTEGLELSRRSGDRSTGATLLSNLASVAASEGDLKGARRMADEALEVQRSIGGKRLVMGLLVQLADYDLGEGAPAAAKARLEEALGIADALGIRVEEATAIAHLADARQRLGDAAGARAAVDEALALARAKTNRVAGIGTSLVCARVEAALGNPAAARSLLEEAIRVAEEANLPLRAEEPRRALAKLQGGGA